MSLRASEVIPKAQRQGCFPTAATLVTLDDHSSSDASAGDDDNGQDHPLGDGVGVEGSPADTTQAMEDSVHTRSGRTSKRRKV